jgi:branched-chain amino acid transport system ATP-binding protein
MLDQSQSAPLLSVSGLEAHYGDFQALYGISLNVHPGEVVAVIGANGAGKTTLMRSVSGLIRNGAAQVSWQGKQIGALRADQVDRFGARRADAFCLAQR